MTNTWIVGLDGSDESESALKWAAARAVERDERVIPIAAWHVPLPIWLLSGRRVVDVDRAGIAAEVAVHSAAALAWTLATVPDTTDVVALCGLDVIPWLQPDVVVERHPEAIAHAQERICTVADDIDPERRAVRSFVVDGPRHALAGAMGDADLVVVGPRGIGGIATALLASVTAWLLHEATCPVAVIPTVP